MQDRKRWFVRIAPTSLAESAHTEIVYAHRDFVTETGRLIFRDYKGDGPGQIVMQYAEGSWLQYGVAPRFGQRGGRPDEADEEFGRRIVVEMWAQELHDLRQRSPEAAAAFEGVLRDTYWHGGADMYELIEHLAAQQDKSLPKGMKKLSSVVDLLLATRPAREEFV